MGTSHYATHYESPDASPATLSRAVEETATPKWETDLQRHGYLPPVDGESIADADYLTARLHRVIATAAEAVADVRAEDESSWRSIADRAELKVIRQQISDFAAELRVYGRSGDHMLHALEDKHSQLRWARFRGSFFGFPADGISAFDAVEEAARELDLIESQPFLGGRCWRGEIDGWRIGVSER